ncbi:MAG: hypothetical protein K6G92_05320 [Bacteroidaceae bacterium]|nr:hypothetical protein [Bacteroidaceae bacterium]
MDKQFTLKLQEWLNTPADKRNLNLGATYLLQLTNNKILYKNISHDLKGHAQFIEFKIKRYLQYRLQDMTQEEVSAMQLKVDNIVKVNALDNVKAPVSPGVSPRSVAQEFRAGKRADHDTLPAEIQALYVENASLMQKMRELHLQLRNLSTQASTCPDSDRYPFLKEMIELDKRYHQNWQAYDSFAASSGETLDGSGVTATTQSKVAEQTPRETARLEQKNILRQINLAKGRYKKNPSEKLKASILSLYQQLTAPSDALAAELKLLGIL